MEQSPQTSVLPFDFSVMDTSLLQLDTIDNNIPALLCQYTYFLNSESSKLFLIGFNRNTFSPTICITSLLTYEQISFSYEEWTCVRACIKYCLKFLEGNSDVAWYSSHSLVIESSTNDNKRFIKISNLDCAASSIELNFEEFKIIEQLAPFISRIFKHYTEHCFDLEVYYRTYVLKCMTSNRPRLGNEHYFSPGNRCLNYFRIFHEIPVLCKTKLEIDMTQ